MTTYKLIRQLPREDLCPVCFLPGMVRALWLILNGEREGQTHETTFCLACYPWPESDQP